MGKKTECKICGKVGEQLPTNNNLIIYKEGICHNCLSIYEKVRINL